ncbi:MAG: hypothetical protein WCB68_00705 [Pyrinomonadaceae bacterium]
MKIARKVTASLIMALLLCALWSSPSSSRDRSRSARSTAGKTLQDSSAQSDQQAQRAAMSDEEKLVRNLYARLMRYQSAATDELAAREGKATGPDDYLTFELRDIRSGPVSEISGQQLNELITEGSGALINLKATHLNQGDGPVHAYYEAQWSGVSSVENPSDAGLSQSATGARTVRQMLRKGGENFKGINRYTSYEVRVQLKGQQRTYRALALYQLDNPAQGSSRVMQPERAKAARVQILDNITTDLSAIYSEESPAVRSPWQKYVKTGTYIAVARSIKETRQAGKDLIPVDAPIGYLPGDDVAPSNEDRQMMAANTACTITVTLTATGTQEVGKATHFISLKNTGNVTITATLDPAGTDPSVITWTGGTAGADNLHRIVSTNSAANTDVTATVQSQSASVRIHVLDATAPPAAAVDAPKTFSNGGAATVPADAFGLTVVTIGDQGVTAPVYHVDPYFSSDRWVFRLRDVSHSYKIGTHSLGRINLPTGNPPTFPLAPGMNLTQSHTEARDDFDTSGLTNTGPRRRSYWVDFITQNHEQAHVDYFYSAPFWMHYMGLFESDDVEATTVSVVYDCNDTTTTTGAAAVTKKTSDWDTAIANRHDAAFQAHFPTAESHAHGVSNPQYAPIRNAIPNP